MNRAGTNDTLKTKKTSSVLAALGPGIITGAADDDPSGIGTYTQAGAQFGPLFLWAALLTWPLMGCVQMACARVGMVTGKGLGSALKEKFPRSVLIVICIALFLANTLNVGADLSAMADSSQMLFGGYTGLYILAFGVAITWATVQLKYSQIAGVLKWLALSLFAYIFAAFKSGPDWKEALTYTFIPHMPSGTKEWSMLVAILGTTISPYLFFWQASQEIEEQKVMGRKTLSSRIGATEDEIRIRRFDVAVGTLFSNIVMYFIILTASLALHKTGHTDVMTSREAAEALEPVAGHFASLLYTLGLLGVGVLAIPTLTGSSAYALAETFKFKQGLNVKLDNARAFYLVIVVSMIFAMIFDFSGVNPIRALYWSAVVNGLLAPFVLLGVLFVIADAKVMKGQPAPNLVIWTVAFTTLLMFLASIAMFVL